MIPASSQVRLLFAAVVAGLIGISAFFHLWKLDSIPPGLYVDESANAYNAWCIALTGADEYGTKMPVFFRCFDDYRDSAPIYLTVPFVKILGLTREAARLPGIVFLLFASVVFAFLVQQHHHNKWLAALSGFGFSFLPWLFVAGRHWGYVMMVFGIIAGWLLLLLTLRKKSWGYAAAAGVAWAFVMYASSLGRPVAALLLLSFVIAYFRMLRAEWRLGLVFVVVLIGALVPMILSAAHSSLPLTSRFNVISIFRDHPSFGDATERFVSRYIGYFDAGFLFFSGDRTLHLNTGFGGQLYRFLIPLVLAGLYCLVQSARSEPSSRFILLGLLVYPIAPSLTESPMHGNRSIHGVIFWALAAVIGANSLWQSKGLGRKLLLLTCCVGAIEVSLYLRDFFGAYPARFAMRLYTGYTEALEMAFHEAGPDGTIYISGRPSALSNPDYIQILFFGRIDPRIYQAGGIPKNRVQLFNGTISNPGILLRASRRRLEMPGHGTAGYVALETNPEPIPTGAVLLAKVPVAKLFEYEIYRMR